MRAILSSAPDLVILDVMLPCLDGHEVCRQVRPRYRGPILMLTARSQTVEEILGLELGADDYVRKPVEPRLCSHACGRSCGASRSARSSWRIGSSSARW